MDDNSHDAGFTHFVPTTGGLLDGLSDSGAGSSLNLFMEPKDIATITGLPQHVYDEAAKYDQAQNTGSAADQRMAAAVTNGQPAASDVDNGDGEAAIERDIRNLKDEAVDRAVSAVRGAKDSTIYTREDGRIYTLEGTRPNRNNNPLNVDYGSLARSHGAIGRDGPFAIFGSPADGLDAAMANFDRLSWHGSMPQYPTSKMTPDFWSGTAPLNALVTMHSPPDPPGHQENDTKGMIRDITRGAHLNPGDNWGGLTDAQKLDFVHSYGRREGYKGNW